MAKRSNNDIWVWGDLRNRRLFTYGLNVLAKARSLSKELNGRSAMVLMGCSDRMAGAEATRIDTAIALSGAAQEALDHGADVVYTVDQPALAAPRVDFFSDALAQAIEKNGPALVLFPLTDFGRDLAARTARMVSSGLIADAVDIRVEDQEFIAACPAWGGELAAELGFVDGTVTGLATVQPHAFQADEVPNASGRVEPLAVGRKQAPETVRLLSCEENTGPRRQLEDAEVVVVGGAGLGNAQRFAELRHLTAALGGELGATRPPVLEHWVDGERMIGQTGKTVRPNLLLSVGTSGAIQYTAGIMESGTIVAINRDANAPIFSVADIGVVADVSSFLPRFTAKVKEAVMREIADVLSDTDIRKNAGASFGAKVQKLREAHGWSLEQLAERTSQPPDYLGQVEEDKLAPPVSFLLRLSKALGVEPGAFLRDDEQASLMDQRAQGFIKRTKNYFYRTLTPGAENEHLRAFMITIEPKQVHKSVEYKHEGEEFVFVMEGRLEITLGNKPRLLKQGESIHFNSETPHKLKNTDAGETHCLVVLYTP